MSFEPSIHPDSQKGWTHPKDHWTLTYPDIPRRHTGSFKPFHWKGPVIRDEREKKLVRTTPTLLQPFAGHLEGKMDIHCSFAHHDQHSPAHIFLEVTPLQKCDQNFHACTFTSSTPKEEKVSIGVDCSYVFLNKRPFLPRRSGKKNTTWQ